MDRELFAAIMEYVDTSQKVIATLLEQKSVKALSPAREAAYAAETARIRASVAKPENQKPHKFEAAEWTHTNGHPRCIHCGAEERTDGMCEGDMVPTGDDARSPSRPTDQKGETGGHAFRGNRFTGGIPGAGHAGEGEFTRNKEMTPKQQAKADEHLAHSPHLRALGLGPQSKETFKAKYEATFARAMAAAGCKSVNCTPVGKFWYHEVNGSDPQHPASGRFTRGAKPGATGQQVEASAKGIAEANGMKLMTATAVIAALSPQTRWERVYVDTSKPHDFPNVREADAILGAVRANPDVKITLDDIERCAKTPACRGFDVEEGVFKFNDLPPAVAATVTGLRWTAGTYAAASAIRIAQNNDLPDEKLFGVINENLTAPKTRTFCNNMTYPGANDGATIDGRMVMGATTIPANKETGNHLGLFFKGGGTFGTAVYRTMNDAVHEAAASHGLLPQEYQAIVWKQLEAEGVGTVYQLENEEEEAA